MIQVPACRLVVAFLAFSTVSVAQSNQQGPPNSPEPSTATGSPGVEQQPQFQPPPPQSPPGATAPLPQGPAQPTGQPQPAYNSYSPPPSYAAPTTTSRAREANDPNYQNGQYRPSEPYNSANDDTESKSKFEMPAWSVRVDPFGWLLRGRLGLELETQVWKFISVELVPVFIVNDQPPELYLGLSGRSDTLYQKSAGIGALAGTSAGVGFWLNGTPMEGYVLRAELTDYAIKYDAHDNAGPIDQFKYVERYFQMLLGSHSKWGAFTLAGTFGFGTALKKVQRCFTDNALPSEATARTSGCANSKQADIAVTRDGGTFSLNPWAYPIDLVMRISLGVAF